MGGSGSAPPVGGERGEGAVGATEVCAPCSLPLSPPPLARASAPLPLPLFFPPSFNLISVFLSIFQLPSDGWFYRQPPICPQLLFQEPRWVSRKCQGTLEATHTQHKLGDGSAKPRGAWRPGLPHAEDFLPKDDPANAYSSGPNQRSEVFDSSTSGSLLAFTWSFPGRISLL